jgi:peptidoglycan/LPS O-acetylase OafA/YrhL
MAMGPGEVESRAMPVAATVRGAGATNAAAPLATPRFYIPQLDGLRFCAFLGVFISHVTYAVGELPTGRVRWYHAEWWGQSALLAGALGVVLFFALSSYLITSLLVREWDTTGRIDVPAFWMRRALRIWPLYFGFLLVYVAVGGLTVPVFAAFSIFAGNWAEIAWRVDTGLAHPLWSVSVEEQFYLTWPLLLAALPRRLLRHAAIGLVVTGVCVQYTLFANGASVTSVWLNTFSHLEAIGIGALIALGPEVRLAPAVRAALGAASALLLVACTGVIWFELVQSSAMYLRVGMAGAATLTLLGAAVACGGLLLASLAGSTWLSRPGIAYLGRISYGLYVFHSTAVWLVGDWWWPYRLPAAFALTVAFAAVSYRFFERPFLRMKRRFTYVRSE